MYYADIWVHAMWGTKNGMPILGYDSRGILCNHIRKSAPEKGFIIDTLGGHKDHLHALMPLNADISISKQMQLIKGESVIWANKSGVFNCRVQWADEYFAVSVSESNLETVRAYIREQERHHRHMTFQEEFDKFLSHFKRTQGVF